METKKVTTKCVCGCTFHANIPINDTYLDGLCDSCGRTIEWGLNPLKNSKIAKINGTCDGQIEEKRFRLPGVAIEAECPNCQHPNINNLGGDDYLTFPWANKPFAYYLCCRECDHEWTINVVLNISLTLAESQEPLGKV